MTPGPEGRAWQRDERRAEEADGRAMELRGQERAAVENGPAVR